MLYFLPETKFEIKCKHMFCFYTKLRNRNMPRTYTLSLFHLISLFNLSREQRADPCEKQPPPRVPKRPNLDAAADAGRVYVKWHRCGRFERENFCFRKEREREREGEGKSRQRQEAERGTLFPFKVGFTNWVAINIARQLPLPTSQVVAGAPACLSLPSLSFSFALTASRIESSTLFPFRPLFSLRLSYNFNTDAGTLKFPAFA